MRDSNIDLPQARADELQERLINFAVRLINLSERLPKTPASTSRRKFSGRTSPAPNYGEARGGKSRADFIHKAGIVLKELTRVERRQQM